MLAQDLTTVIESKIQGQVATFLGLKSTIVKLQASSDLATQDAGNRLMATQSDLETTLPDILAAIKGFQSGAYTISDTLKIGAFAVSLEKQISDVNSAAKAAGIAGAAGAVNWGTVGIVAVASVVGIIFLASLGRGR